MTIPCVILEEPRSFSPEDDEGSGVETLQPPVLARFFTAFQNDNLYYCEALDALRRVEDAASSRCFAPIGIGTPA